MNYSLSAIRLWAALREKSWEWDQDVDAALPSQRWIPFTRHNPDAFRFVEALKVETRAEYSLRQLSFAVTMVGAEQRGELGPGVINLIEAQKDLL